MTDRPDPLRTASGTAPGASRPGLVALAAIGWTRAVSNPSVMIVAAAAAQNVLRLAGNLVLARLLAPNVFALMAITTLVLVSIHMISDVGIALTALREGEISQCDEDRLWSIQVIRGAGIGLIVAATAIPVGWIYHDTQLRDALFALSFAPLLDGAKSLYPVLELAHRRLLPSTLLELGGRALSIIVSILVALVSPTIWSLVLGILVSGVVAVIASYAMAGRVPRLIIDRAYIARQWQISRWIQASSTLSFAGAQIDKAAFPFLFGLPALGIYGIGATLASIPSQVTQRWSANVYYPLAVKLLRGERRARDQLLSVRTTMLFYALVGTLAIMAISPAFFLLLYPARYHGAAAIAVVLGAGAYFEVAESSLRHFPLVEGTPHFEVWAVVARLAAFAICVGLVVFTGAGVIGYALSYVGGLVASYLFMLAVCVRRGYLRSGLDLALLAALAGAAVAIWLLPLARPGRLGLLAEGGVVTIVAIAAMLLIYRRRGFPSLSVEPTPPMLREAAEDDFGLRTGDVPVAP